MAPPIPCPPNAARRCYSQKYLLQQLETGTFLGIVAAGMMMVILLGHIDLSIPWTLTAAAMMATTVGGDLAIPTGLVVGLAIGLFNGLGVAYLRIPSMIFTLGVDSMMPGLMIAHTSGFAPQTAATPLMRYLASDKILGIPVAIFVWAAVSILIATILRSTSFGRSIYATGNREGAAYLSGIRTRGVVIGAFMMSGACAGMAGVLLAGYSSQAYQGMGNTYLLPSIAAVALGGTRIIAGPGLERRGSRPVGGHYPRRSGDRHHRQNRAADPRHLRNGRPDRLCAIRRRPIPWPG
ncbi:MAG: ribose transport system permease protein [Paracoccaceae bacterium]